VLQPSLNFLAQVFLALNCDTGELLALKEVPASLLELAAAGTEPGGVGGGGAAATAAAGEAAARGGVPAAAHGGAAEALAQLEREVALLSGLRHPNIVRYVGTARGGAGGPGSLAGGLAVPGASPPLYILLGESQGWPLSVWSARDWKDIHMLYVFV
jgi:hypothetical protein